MPTKTFHFGTNYQQNKAELHSKSSNSGLAGGWQVCDHDKIVFAVMEQSIPMVCHCNESANS